MAWCSFKFIVQLSKFLFAVREKHQSFIGLKRFIQFLLNEINGRIKRVLQLSKVLEFVNVIIKSLCCPSVCLSVCPCEVPSHSCEIWTIMSIVITVNWKLANIISLCERQ
jgi:hypothetical protein